MQIIELFSIPKKTPNVRGVFFAFYIIKVMII